MKDHNAEVSALLHYLYQILQKMQAVIFLNFAILKILFVQNIFWHILYFLSEVNFDLHGLNQNYE
jgi:hypothetical protein